MEMFREIPSSSEARQVLSEEEMLKDIAPKQVFSLINNSVTY